MVKYGNKCEPSGNEVGEQKKKGINELIHYENKRFKMDQNENSKTKDTNPSHLGQGFQAYTHLNITREIMLIQVEHHCILRWLKNKQKTPSWDKAQYDRFHNYRTFN